MTFYAVVPLLSVLSYIVLTTLALRHPSKEERRAFALYLAAAGIWSFFSFLLHLDEPFLNRFTLMGSRFLIVAFIWMVVTYYYFVQAFVGHKPRLGLWVGAFYVLSVSALAGFGFLPESAHTDGGVLFIEHGIFLYFLALMSLTLAGGAAVSLVRHYHALSSEAARSKVIYLLGGLSLVLIGGLTNLNDSLVKYPIDHMANLANAILITYAIGKHRLLDIRLVVRKGLAYSTLTALVTAVYLFALFGIQSTFDSQVQGISLLLAALLAFLTALLFAPLRGYLQERVDSLFFGDSNYYRKLLLSFSSRMSGVLDLRELAQGMLQPAMSLLRPQWAGLMFPDPESGDFRVWFQEGEPDINDDVSPKALRLRRDSPLLTWLTQEGTALRAEMLEVIPQARGMWLEEREGIDAHRVDLLCPIISRGTLSGLLVLGLKYTDDPYSQEETELLMTMCNGAAVAVDNARIFESLRREQQRAKQLLNQVVAAQEEERQRVASELHDGVAQWLVNASYQMQVCMALMAQGKSQQMSKDMAEVDETLRASLKELRQVLSGLRPPALEELGLTHAIIRDLERLEETGVSCSIQMEGTPMRLPTEAEIATYRVVQEGLNNIRKHANAGEARVRLEFGERELSIRIKDNGAGFNTSEALEGDPSIGHLGLVGMKQRVEGLGGTLRISSKIGLGTTVDIHLPVETGTVEEEAQWMASA